MVLLHGGQISVSSEVNHGSVFSVCLPINPAEQQERRRRQLISRDLSSGVFAGRGRFCCERATALSASVFLDRNSKRWPF